MPNRGFVNADDFLKVRPCDVQLNAELLKTLLFSLIFHIAKCFVMKIQM